MDRHLNEKRHLGKVRALSIHADYRCEHSGVCCTMHWDVPMELRVYRSLQEAVAAGRLKTSAAAAGLEPFVVDPALPEDAAAIFERRESGACVFFEQDSRLCIVHRDLGEEALATTCRTFPRLAVDDARGTSITLSHFCPTAASLLFRDDVPLEIVESPPAFPPADYDGLTAAPDDLPPLLRPNVLMDLDGYAAWERHMVAVCAAAPDAESALATMALDASSLRTWTGGGGVLVAAVARLPREIVHGAPHASLAISLAAYREAMQCVSQEMRPEPDEAGLAEAFTTHVVPEWHRFPGAAPALCGGQGVRVVDRVSGAWRRDHRARARGGARARARRGRAPVPRRGRAARRRAAQAGVPAGGLHPEPPGGR